MEEVEKQTDQVKSGGVDVLTLVAFLAVVILGGSNAVAVRFSNLELRSGVQPSGLLRQR